MDIYRDAASVIPHCDALVFVNGNNNPAAFTRQGFIYGIINDLINEVMKRFDIGTANIHARAAAHCFEPFKDLNIACVIVFLLFHFFSTFDQRIFSSACLARSVSRFISMTRIK